MQPLDEAQLANPLRVVLVGTGTGVGKTHVACALLAAWSARAAVVGLKPIETGVDVGSSGARGLREWRAVQGRERPGPERPRRGAKRRADDALPRANASGASDQEQLAMAAQMFHVKRPDARHRGSASKRLALDQPLRSLYAFPEPVSPHLAARDAGIRIDLGQIDRWVSAHAAQITVIETAGGLFSPLGHGATNFDLLQALRPDAAILVAPDRLGVLHELTTTLALAAARSGPALAVVLSAPSKRDASTDRNADELAALGIARSIADFPRAPFRAPATIEAARRVIGWIERAASVAPSRSPTDESGSPDATPE